MKRKTCSAGLALATAALLAPASLLASSHREAPLITTTPKLDGTDFYMFNSYETGRSNFVTLVACYLPLQDAYGGPNYFSMDTNSVYEIHIENSGDAVEDVTFQFRFQNTPRNIALAIGPAGNQRTNAVPVLAVGPITATNNAALNLDQTYSVNIIRGPRRTGVSQPISQDGTGSTVFTKPMDNAGNKTFPDYEAYANSYQYTIDIPGCPIPGRMFVGQRKDPFVVNLGETFDLVNISTSPLGPEDANKNSLYYKNVTAFILEVPAQCLTNASSIIGGWTTASQVNGTNYTQVSRLGSPLVNEVVIGLKDKDAFNASEPKNDGQFADYVTHPTLPAIIELLYGGAGVKAPTLFPRADLVAAFLTGVTGLNANGSVAEMLRLNTAIAPTPLSSQNNMGVIGGDNGGFPNGRRPGDDVVDIALRVVMGRLISLGLFGTADQAPSGSLNFTDGATVNAGMFQTGFPYLLTPIPGSPNDPTVNVTVQQGPTPLGPYLSVPATFDPASKSLSVANPGGGAAFFKLKSDTSTGLTGLAVGATNVTLGVSVK
jgi:hypothetical protein